MGLPRNQKEHMKLLMSEGAGYLKKELEPYNIHFEMHYILGNWKWLKDHISVNAPLSYFHVYIDGEYMACYDKSFVYGTNPDLYNILISKI